MDNDNYWDDDNVSEYQMMEEDIDEQALTAEEMAEEIADDMDYDEPEVVDATEEQIDDIQEESAYELDDQESNVIFNARLRLEQAKLYEMLINHSLFEGVDASPDAVGIVENEIKHFIVKRLELLLGIRKPKPRTITVSEVELPFNEVEVDALKAMAYKISKGQSSQSAPMRVSSKQTIKPLTGSTQSQLKPLGKRPILKQEPIDTPEPQPQRKIRTKPRNTPLSRKKVREAVQTTPKPKPRVRPKKNVVNKPKVSSGGAMSKRKLTPKEIDELARADIKAMSGRKSIDKLKGKEKAKAIKEVNERHATKADGGQSFPSAGQLEVKYLTQQLNGRSAESVLDSMANNLMKAKRKLGR